MFNFKKYISKNIPAEPAGRTERPWPQKAKPDKKKKTSKLPDYLTHRGADDHRARLKRRYSEEYIYQYLLDISEIKSSNKKGLAHKVKSDSHKRNPEWGKADHTEDPKKSFGAAATRSSSNAAIRKVRRLSKAGIKRTKKNAKKYDDAVSRDIHGAPKDMPKKGYRGWGKTARYSKLQTPEQKKRRSKLVKTSYKKLSEPEKEKDREIARVAHKYHKAHKRRKVVKNIRNKVKKVLSARIGK